MMLEVWLGAVKDSNPTIDYGNSDLYTLEELEEAAVQVKCQFASFTGCQLHTLRYAGDAYNTPEELASLNHGNKGEPYTQVAKFLSDFDGPEKGSEVWEPGEKIKDYEWWLARTANGGWQLVTWGYC
jgi:D-alanyl-D-alanine carboxypeptidase